MKKKFITNLALVIFLNLLVKPFWVLGIDRSVQNVVGAEQYGLYFALFNFSLILNIVLDLGITNFNNRNISQNNQLLNKHLSNIIIFRFFLGILYFVITIGLAWLGKYSIDEIKLLMLLVFNQFLLSFILYLRSNIAGLQLFKTDSIISVLDRFLMIIICSILLWGNVTHTPFQIKWFVFAQTAAYIVTTLVALTLVLLKSGKIALRLDRKFVFTIIKKSLPFALLILLMAAYNRIDAVLILELLPNNIGRTQSGIYAQAFRILDAAAMFAMLFAGLLLPMFSKMTKHKEPIGQLTQLSFILIVVPAIIFAITSAFFRKEIMDILYHQHVESSATIFAILMFSFIAMATTYIFGTLLTANGNLKQLNIMAVCGVILNIILNIILIPKYQALGAAISNLITQFFTAGIQVLIAFNIFKLKINYKLLILLLIFAVGVAILGVTLRNLLSLNWLASMITMLTLSIIFAFSIGLIKIKDIYLIIKHDK